MIPKAGTGQKDHISWGRLSENQESGKPPRQKEKKRPGEVCTTAEGGV